MGRRRGAGTPLRLRADVTSCFGSLPGASQEPRLERPGASHRSRQCTRAITAWGRGPMWNQVYNPLDNTVLSTIAAAVPVITLLVLIASGKVKAHIAAIIAVIVTNLITIAISHMPADMSIRASLLGVVAGFFPIGWIVLNVIFLYQITVATGRFELLKRAIGG